MSSNDPTHFLIVPVCKAVISQNMGAVHFELLLGMVDIFPLYMQLGWSCP